MAPFKQHFFVRGAYLGSSGRKQAAANPLWPPKGSAFFCPDCSELWANCPIEGQQTIVYMVTCDKHPAWSLYTAPGSMWQGFDKDWLRDIPLFLAKREFALMMKLYEGANNDG